ncbi:ROK family protein [Actinoplanes sp. CA-142083]|uniref:ROK family transcriptional regulator n=1 Tax=Actinoplanes sp. CA-142083 TaxID=3239903 RepID=UPI003D8F1080
MLRNRGVLARSDIARLTKLPRAAVTELLAGLARDNVVEECPPPAGENRSGRPSPHFRLAVGDGLLAGLAIGADGIRAIVTDLAGVEKYRAFRPVELTLSARPDVRAGGELVRDLLAENGHALSSLKAAAISVPAPVHPVTGRFGPRGVLPMFADFSPAEEVAAVLGVPVNAGNNLNVREVGPLCICGSRGCLATYLSPRYFLPLGGGPPDEEQLLDLVTGGDRPAQRALLDAGRLIGRTIAPLCNALNPSIVVVGGRFIEAGSYVVDGIRESVQRHCAPAAAAAITVRPAALGADVELLGAVESLL